MNIGVLEDRWVSGAKSVRWRDGDATRLIGALFLAVIFHLAFATSVTEFLKDEPEETKPLLPPEEPTIVAGAEAASDEAREEPDEDEIAVVDAPPPRPAPGGAPAGEAFPAAAVPPPAAVPPAVELPPELAEAPTALPEFEPIVQADPAAIGVAILPPKNKPRVIKKDLPRETLSLLASSDSFAVLGVIDDTAVINSLGALSGSGTLADVLSSSTGAGLGNSVGVEGGVVGGEVGTGFGRIGTGPGPSIDLLQLESTYTRRISSAVARIKSYPAEAEDDGLEGTVTLALTIDRAGTITAVEVARSSGHAILDEAAVRSVKKLGRLPAPPAELNWEETRKVRIPVKFIYE